MRLTDFKFTLRAALQVASILFLGVVAAFGQQQINLTAGATTTTLPDGTAVPMWGYSCGAVVGGSTATCASSNPAAVGWSPVVITVPTGQGLTINLTNSLTFLNGNSVPTSLVVVGQLGGGLGTPGGSTPSPDHTNAQVTTWPVADPGTTGTAPTQGTRVRSFSTEVAAGATTPLTWPAATLRPGTYLLESGTHPSIQGPMGLYGILVVTTAPAGATAGTAYPGVAYNADVPLVLSEIDAVQNNAVNTAVNTAGFTETAVWSGQKGACGDPTPGNANFGKCYPPAVNYTPMYFLVNGVSFDRTKAQGSFFATTPALTAPGTVLVRLVNAGLRMHVPSIVGAMTGTSAGFSLIAEDGNVLPGIPRIQSEVFLAAGKTYDVTISAALGTAYPVADRELSLRLGGMQAYLGAGPLTAAGFSVPGSAGLLTTTGFTGFAAAAAADTYNSVIAGKALVVSDPAKGVIANDTNINGVKVVGAAPAGLILKADGTFTYTGAPTSFTYCGNGATSGPACALVTLGAAPIEAASGITVTADSYTSKVATSLSIKSPGVLANDKDAAGYPLTVATPLVGTSGGVTVTVDPNGGFTATVPAHTGPLTATFTYRAQNAQGTLSAGNATVTLNFPVPSNLSVTVVDGKQKTSTIADYRWIIEEDRTFYVDPACRTNPPPAGCPAILPTFGTNFHTSYMPVVAQGCTGSISCESGQTILDPTTGSHVSAVCDSGNGICRPGSAKAISLPGDVALDTAKRYYISVLPGDAMGVDGAGAELPGTHAMGGSQVAFDRITNSWKPVTVIVEPTPLPPAKVSVFVFEDDYPLNGEHDAGGGIDVLAQNEPGLEKFNITLFDDVGQNGDAAGQLTYDMFNMPLSNSLAGTKDPATGLDACPISQQATDDPNQQGITGVIPVCPKYESDGKTLSALAGQAIIANLPPGRYGVVATPGADRIARGEEWLQTNTLDGGKAHDSFVKVSEPSYFQEYGPAGYHVVVGFANAKIINSRKTAAFCTAAGGCNSTITGKVTGVHMSRTPDERLYSTESRDTFGYTQCYVSLGSPDGADFAFAKCADDGTFLLSGIPSGDWRITAFDQWNDQIVDGYVTPVRVNAATVDLGDLAVHQWKSNLYTRTFFDQNGDGVSQDSEPGLALVPTNVRYRDGSFSNFNSTDLSGFAGFNEVFPLFNWYVVETDSTRYKSTGIHVVYDAGGPVDGSSICGQAGYPACGTSTIGQNLARTKEDNPLPAALRVPGARYCANADCPTGDTAGGSTGRVDPAWVVAEAWQGFIGQNNFLEFAKKQFAAATATTPAENGGIRGHVVYSLTRPFDDPAMLLQLSWEPLVPNVTINLYQVGTAPDGSRSLMLVDTTKTSSWDDWAQGFRSDGIPNMNCPGQGPGTGPNADPFFFSLNGQPMGLDPLKRALPNNSQFKCYDGMHMWNQLQPAPYDGMYQFPSVTGINPTPGANYGKPLGSNCHMATVAEPWGCVPNPDTTDPFRSGQPMLPSSGMTLPNGTKATGKYVVEMVTPPGYELVKEEDKNILMGDVYVAPVTMQFGGLGSIFIMPDQAAVASSYNPYNSLNPTTDLGAVPRHEGDTGSIEVFWPCVGAARVVPDFMSLFPGSGQNAPFAGATRNLCDRKEVTLEDQASALAKFYVFTSTHVASHFTGQITDDFTAEFDPFSPSFGEKFAPPDLPVSIKDWAGNEVNRVYADQWGVYNGLNYSSWGVNPPDPSGYVPQMMVMCMNDKGPQGNPDPLFNQYYSQFCYELPFMPGQTHYFDTPVVPTSAFAGAGYNNADCAYPDTTPAISEVDGDGIGPWISAVGNPITIHALGDQSVNNYGYSGPRATSAPFNQKTVTRHYGFGASRGTGSVTIGGVTATVVSWSDTQIVVTLPTTGAQVPACSVQQQAQYGGSNALCGEIVVTAGNGKASVDTVTLTVGGKAPTHIAATAKIQDAIDMAMPGDLLIIDPGTQATSTLPAVPAVHTELLIMWKPVRLQGVGAASSVIDASAHPSGVLDPWRAKMACLFGLATNGQPFSTPGNPVPLPNGGGFLPPNPFDPTGTYECGTTGGTPWSGYVGAPNAPQVDRMPLEGIVGWDTTMNGNLAEQLQEPTLLGAYEGAGITVVGKGVRYPAGLNIFGVGADTGGFATESQFPVPTIELGVLNGPLGDCVTSASNPTNPFPSNFLCNPSRIDGLSVTNSSQGGGGILVHGWAHNLEISNNRVYNNTGTLSGGLTIGIAETGDALLTGNGGDPVGYNGGTLGGFDQQPWTCIPGAVVAANNPYGYDQVVSPPGRVNGQQLPFCFDRNVSVHHNAITTNSSIGDELFSATPSGAGGISFGPGTDGYKLTQNWICGNLSTGDGGGVVHLGYIENGLIEQNKILFNQSSNPTIPANGGGIAIMTTAPDGLDAQGLECGSVTDIDCPPGLGDGIGPGLKINANLIMGNAAEAGSGGGIRFQGVNGTEVGRFPLDPTKWYSVNVTNNIISNNVAGWDGAGVSLHDSLAVNLINNTIVSNDTTASAGTLFNTFRSNQASAPPPGPCTANCGTASPPQPAGVAATGNSAGLIASFPATIICPAGHSSGLGSTVPAPIPNGDCRRVSYPELYNNVVWQNRSFHISVAPMDPQFLQSVVTLVPTLNQTSTGACIAPPNGTYWDIGVRGDTGPTNHSSGSTLTPFSSVLSSGGYTGNHNSTSNPTVVAQYCNGSRIPPEALTALGIIGASGYNVPPGTNEGNVPTPIFSLTAGATVDEGNNWINMSWGPLALTNPVTGTVLGNYALAAGSPAIDYITSGNSALTYGPAPTTDFFGNPRKTAGNPNVDAGAVEGAGSAGGGGNGGINVSPTSLAFGNVVTGSSSTARTLTLSNPAGGSTVTGINIAITAPFARSGGSCPTTANFSLNAGVNCTIGVTFTPTAATAYNGTAMITGSVSITGSPVSLTGTGIAAPALPTLAVLDNFNRANANTLGANWTQLVALGASAIRVNTNQASDLAVTGTAFWSPTAFGAKQGAAFTIANTTLNNDALFLAATGSPTLSVYPNFIRVQYNGGNVTVATTTNNGVTYTTAGTLAGAFANGDTLTAVLDGTNAVAAPTVYIWRTTGATTTYLGSVPLPANALWQGGGRIGMQLPGGARVDDFAGANVP